MERTLSSMEAKLVLQLEWDGETFVDLDGISSILKCSKGYARKIAYTLKTKGWLESVSPGKYLLISAKRGISPVVPDMNPYVVARVLNEPYFFSYRAACLHHGLTTQVPTVVHVILLRQRASIKFKNMEFQFVKVAKHKFFGWKPVDLFGERVNMADLEKTVIDAIDRQDLAGGIEEVVKIIFNAYKKLSWDKLSKYIANMKSSTLCRRLGFIIDLLNILVPKTFEDFLLQQVKKDKAYLASPQRWGTQGKLNRKWNLINNVPSKILMSDIEVI